MRILITLALVFFSFLSIFCQPISYNKDSGEAQLNFRSVEINCNRDKIIQDYITGYEETQVNSTELAWDGDVDACKEGQISALALEKTRARINYFRKLVGIENKIIFNDEKNIKCQKAVLMMDAANKLDHFPTSDWLCSSTEGIEAAGKSNLSYGSHSSGSVPQYIQDSGNGNGAAGHRRWILYPKAYEFGFGSTNWGTAMWVIGGNKNPETYPDYVAYPSPGYFPKNLVYSRWSFSKKGANFSSSNITMTGENNASIEFTIEEIENGYGDNTLVWNPQINLYNTELGTDLYFQVSIDSVKVGAEYHTYEYEVLAINMQPTNEPYSYISPSCGKANGSITIEFPEGYKNVSWSTGAENTLTVGNLAAGMHSVSITDKLGCVRMMDFELEDLTEPQTLTSINGNLSSSPSVSEMYSTDQFDGGNYSWSITNGEIINQNLNSEIEVKWNEDVSEGQLCVYFVDANACESNEVCVEVGLMTSGLKHEFVNNISLYPNPVDQLLSVQIPLSDQITQVEIIDSKGQIVIDKTLRVLNKTILEINVSSFNHGLYFIKLTGGDSYYSQKFIKI